MTIHQLATKVIWITVLAGMIVPPGLAGQGGGDTGAGPCEREWVSSDNLTAHIGCGRGRQSNI